MFTVMKYTNMKETLGGCILCRWTIEAHEHIQLNQDTFAPKEDDYLFERDNKIRDPHILISKRAPKGKKISNFWQMPYYRPHPTH